MEVEVGNFALWSAFMVITGAIVGGFWKDLRHGTRAAALTQAEGRLRSLDARSDHFSFGVADLQVRIDAANKEIAMLRADLKVRRAEYDRLNTTLRSRWDEAVDCKRTLAAQEEDALALQGEIANWKEKLDTLYKRMENGAISDRTLKRELASGLSAIFEEAGDALPTVQRLLLKKTIEIGMSDADETPGFEEIIKLLSARVELLESQVSYWQDRSTGHSKATVATASVPKQDRSANSADKPAKSNATEAPRKPVKATRKQRRRSGGNGATASGS